MCSKLSLEGILLKPVWKEWLDSLRLVDENIWDYEESIQDSSK